MAEEIFRPKKFDPSGQEKLNKVDNVRQQIQKELSNPDAPVQIKGNIPKAMLDALAAQRNAAEEVENTSTEEVRNFVQKKDLRVTGSPRLEELLASIKETTAIYGEVQLPSLGRFYNGEDGPVDGILHVKPMTGEEEQILATPRYFKKGQAINMIFQRCIKEKYDTNNFLAQDRTYLLIFLRGISYGTNYDVEIKCPNCDKKFNHTINLNSDLMLNECPEDFNQDSLNGILPTTQFRFTYRLATGIDDQKVQDYRDRKIREFDTNAVADDTLIYRASLLINDIEGVSDKNEIRQLLKKLPINDVAYLRTTVNDPPFGIDSKMEIPCPYCVEDFELDMPYEANFFFPKHKKKQ